MNKIRYKVGDATSPCINKGVRVIFHICNDVGAWGAGFVLALSKKWKEPEINYKLWANNNDDKNPFKLGHIQIIPLEDNLFVVNMIAQTNLRSDNNTPPIRYNALQDSLIKMLTYFSVMGDVTFHCPRIGAGLAGGEWEIIENILNLTIINDGYDLYVYDLPHEKDKWQNTSYE